MHENVEWSSDDPPLVTLVVPAFNVEEYVGACLDSLLGQSYPKIEIIVLDDASTDGTLDVLQAYSDRVHVVAQDENRGIYENANDGIRRANGELICVYHSDDVYEPDIVEREVGAFREHPELGAVFCLDSFIDAEGRVYGRLQPPPAVPLDRPMEYAEVLEHLLTYKNPFLRCPGAMVRADVYEDVGLYDQERWKNTSDVDMWLRVAREYPIMILGEHLYRYRHFHGSSAERYHHLRVQPNRFFAIMDHHLEAEGVAEPGRKARREYEAHRAEDRLFNAVAHYIRGETRQASQVLAEISLSDILGGSEVDRLRLSALYALLRVLCRMPRLAVFAEVFRRRWYTRSPTPTNG